MPTYAETGNVNALLGNLVGRLPTGLPPIDDYLEIAHATVLDELANVYPALPAFQGAGLEIVKWAEAKLAAAELLSAMRVNIPAIGDQPERLRKEAYSAIRDGVVGYPPGSSTSPEDPDDPGGPTVVHGPGPRSSSFTPASAFEDPYDALRGSGIRYL